MVLLKKLSIATAGASAILSVFSVPVSAFTINLPANSNWDILDPLGNLSPGATGTVGLNPVVPRYLAPPTAGSTLFTLFQAEAPTYFPNWTAVSGAALGGTLTIDEYDARDFVAEPQPGWSTPRGGVDMKATYTRAATDPEISNLRFIQLFIDNSGPNGALVRHIDPFPNTDRLPWYYTDAQHNFRSTPTTMTIVDTPSDPIPPSIPFNRRVSFETYLATFDNTTKVATIRDGWSWGYDINVQTEAVPEPLTILASATALGFGAFFKKEVSRKPKKN
jgi:hypothetical protein